MLACFKLFAALWNLPVVFVVVNNFLGMGTTVEKSSAESELYKRAVAYRMHGERVDGDTRSTGCEFDRASDKCNARGREWLRYERRR